MQVRRFATRLASHFRWRASQIADWPRVAFRLGLSRVYNDRVLSRHRRLHTGSRPVSDRIAIHVIYAPKGIQPSHLRTLDCIADAGYAALVVANDGLPDADRAAMLSRCWLLLERPNFGYDFGAYRDGLRLVQERLPVLQRLALVNDSVWFPLPGCENWFTLAAGLPADYVGAASNLGVEPRPRSEAHRQQWQHDPARPDFHFCSFLLSFGPAVLRSRAFLRFWSRLPLSNHKEWVVRRGEVALSRMLRAAGFHGTTTTPMADLGQCLQGLSDARLQQILARLIIPEDPALRAMRDRELAAFCPADRHKAEAFILYAVAETGPAYALAELAVKEYRQPFLKKSPVWKDAAGAAVTLEILAEAGATDDLAEARALIATRAEYDPGQSGLAEGGPPGVSAD